MSKALFRSLSTVSLMTFISRILGFARDLIAAQIFGASASPAVDAFYIAFKIPNFMRNLFAEGAFSQAFVPTLSQYREQSSKTEVAHFIARIAGGLGLVLFIVTALFIAFAPFFIHLFAPGLDLARFEIAAYFLKITAPYLMLISLAALVGSILNTYGQFAIPAFTPCLLNVCLIGTSYGITKYFTLPIEAQAWGVLLAGFVQLGFQLPMLKKLGFLVAPRWGFEDKGVKHVLRLMIPALFGASIGQISILVNTLLASFLSIGSVTWLYYSERLAYFPLGVFGVALSTVILPVLSRHHANASKEAFSNSLYWGIQCNLLIGIPAALTMLFLAGPLVVSLFQYGKFSIYDVLMTQKSVVTYAIGLPSFMLVKLLSSAFYARQDIKTPVKIAALILGVNIAFSFYFMHILAHAGLALATSLASWCNVIILWIMLYRKEIYRMPVGSGKFLKAILLSNIIVALFLFYAVPETATWISWSWAKRLGGITGFGFLTIGLYLLTLWVFGVRASDLRVKT